jgi:tetratricopeptide (TPR) repeat protein
MDAADYAAAAELLQRSAAMDPHFKTLELLGECRIHLGQLREAIIPLAAAVTLNDQARAPSLLADVFSRLEEKDDAVRIARLALARHPENQLALNVLGKYGYVAEQ